MKLAGQFTLTIKCLGILLMVLILYSCEDESQHQQLPEDIAPILGFPDFTTPTGKYFDYRINNVPSIEGEIYQLKISGAVHNPASFSLEELRNLEMVDRTLTIECIGNPANGKLLGTASWKGFRIYDLLDSLGILDGASTVKYISADGYYTYNRLDELQNREVLGALYMNDDPIPPLHGFPLRIIFPGYYGVRQPGWIVEMEVLESGPEDYWSKSGWETDSAMTIDSKIFFPGNNSKFALGDSVRIGGTAYGAKRISSVEITLDDGTSWLPTTIYKSLDSDFVWIFWETYITHQKAGTINIRSRATAVDGSVQPGADIQYLDGTNSWPKITITLLE